MVFYPTNEDTKTERGPAFLKLPECGVHELAALELMFRNGARPEFRGSGLALYSVLDEDSGGEFLERDIATKWRALMGWPDTGRYPTIEECLAFRLTQEGKLIAAHWGALKAARAVDEAEALAQAAYEAARGPKDG
jgi:hypothetical protein